MAAMLSASARTLRSKINLLCRSLATRESFPFDMVTDRGGT
jgi:hypothetical protein